MSYLIYRQPQAAAPETTLVQGDWVEVPGVDTVPLYGDSAPHGLVDLVPADATAEYGRKALISVEGAEIRFAIGRDVTDEDKLFIPPDLNVEIEVGKQRLSATVLEGAVPATVQVYTAKFIKK